MALEGENLAGVSSFAARLVAQWRVLVGALAVMVKRGRSGTISRTNDAAFVVEHVPVKTCPDERIVIAIPKGSAIVVFGRYRGVIANAGGFPCIELLESIVINGHVCAPHTNLYAERDSVLIGQQSGLLYGDRRLKLKDLLPDDVF